MLDFEKTVQNVLDELKNFSGSAPEISIDYANEKLYIRNSSSGFLKKLLMHDQILVHLSYKGLLVEYFKD